MKIIRQKEFGSFGRYFGGSFEGLGHNNFNYRELYKSQPTPDINPKLLEEARKILKNNPVVDTNRSLSKLPKTRIKRLRGKRL